MKSLATWVVTASCLFSSCLSPVLGQDEPGATSEGESGAKGLFFQQLDRPNDQLNTGVQYWIELHRGGQTLHATNKTKFRSGDSIRFHVKPNIDGFAYIILREGSQGEQSQLFPDAENKEDKNVITHGKEMVLPMKGALVFDQNPGLEKLTLLISRKPIDAKAYATGESPNVPQRIAMASSGSKDLIPNQVLVSYVSPAGVYGAKLKDMPAAQAVSVGQSETKTALTGSSSLRPASLQSSSNSTTAKSPANSGKGVSATESNSSKASTKIAAAKNQNGGMNAKTHESQDLHGAKDIRLTKKQSARHIDRNHIAKIRNSVNVAMVTVVYKDPGGVLAADISLEHL